MTFDNHTTVQTGLDEQVILVGEEHSLPGAEHSESLMEEVLEEYDPQSLAIEATIPSAGRRAGMGAAQSFAEQEGRPITAIDDGSASWGPTIDDTGKLLSVANTFAEPIEEDGDVAIESIDHARRAVLEEFGEETTLAMYDDRERAMARRLRYMVESDDFETPIVAGIGTFHILSLKAYLENEDDTEALSERRIKWNDAPNVADEPSTSDTARSSASNAA